jgi:hypothetical protein
VSEKIVDCLRKVEAISLDLWRQVIKLQYVVEPDGIVAAQLCLDRVHRFQPSQSRPVAYYRFSMAGDLLSLATDLLAAACALNLQSKAGSHTTFDVKQTVDSILEAIRGDIYYLTDLSLDEISKKRAELRHKGEAVG